MSKAEYLIENGWREVPDDIGTCWESPVSLTGELHYFSLEAAYELETEGEGVYAYAGERALAELSRAADVDSMQRLEDERFALTGVRLGEYPNY